MRPVVSVYTISHLVCSGNFLIIASSTSVVIALTWGGVQFPWTSAHVLAPLILGLVGMVFFMAYEAIFAREPLVSSSPTSEAIVT